MTTAYLYLGPEAIGWIGVGNQLLSSAKTSSFPELSDKLAYIESYLAQTSSSTIHLVVGNSLEEVSWQSSESRHTSLSRHSAQRLTRRAMRSQAKETLPAFGRQTHKLWNAHQHPSVDSTAADSLAAKSVANESGRSKSEEDKFGGGKSVTNDSGANDSLVTDPLRVRQQFSATRQRKLGFTADHVCPQQRNPGKSRKLIREFECAAHPDTRAWYEAAAMLSSGEALLISHTLVIESLRRSQGLSETTLLVVELEVGFARHIYFSAGMVCLSRLVSTDLLESDDDQVRSDTRDTLQHISRMRAGKSKSKDNVDKDGPIAVQRVSLWCTPLLSEQSSSNATNSEACIYDFLEKHIGEPTASLSSVVPSTVLKSVVVENHFIAARKRDLQRQSRHTLLRGAIGLSLTGLLLWQLTQLYAESRGVHAAQAQLLLDQAELNRLQALQSTGQDSEWHDDSGASGFEPPQMKYVVETGRSMHKRSILFPAACLLRIQEIKAATPAVSLNRIEWRSDNDGLHSQYQESPSKVQGLQIQLNGQIDPSLPADSGLQLFESFLQSLINGFSLQAVDEVQYPFGADPHGQIRGGSKDLPVKQEVDRKNFMGTAVQENPNTVFEIKITVSQSSVSELILMVESLVPEV